MKLPHLLPKSSSWKARLITDATGSLRNFAIGQGNQRQRNHFSPRSICSLALLLLPARGAELNSGNICVSGSSTWHRYVRNCSSPCRPTAAPPRTDPPKLWQEKEANASPSATGSSNTAACCLPPHLTIIIPKLLWRPCETVPLHPARRPAPVIKLFLRKCSLQSGLDGTGYSKLMLGAGMA